MYYLRTRRNGSHRDAFMIFPKNTDHLQMARSLNLSPNEIVSGGQVGMSPLGPECFGVETGLNLPSLPDDTMLLREQWNAPQSMMNAYPTAS